MPVIIILSKGSCRKHPEGGGPSFLGGVCFNFSFFRGGTHQIEPGEFTMVSQPIRLILVDWFVFHFCLGRFPFIFFGCLTFIFFYFFLNGKRSKKKWKTNQSTKINLIGCDTIVNSPSFSLIASSEIDVLTTIVVHFH